jgi:hypothetical protein
VKNESIILPYIFAPDNLNSDFSDGIQFFLFRLTNVEKKGGRRPSPQKQKKNYSLQAFKQQKLKKLK